MEKINFLKVSTIVNRFLIKDINYVEKDFSIVKTTIQFLFKNKNT